MNHFDYVDDEVANWRQGFHFAPATNFASLSTGKKTDRQTEAPVFTRRVDEIHHFRLTIA